MTADKYDEMHVAKNELDEHFFALNFMIAALEYFEIQSILEIGSGTGRAIQYIKKKKPDLRIAGIEPVYELRRIGHSKGLGDLELIEGDGLACSYSVVADYKQIHAQCRKVHLLNTKDGVINPYRTASHIALLAIK